VKTIKIFDGIKVTTDDEVKKYPDMTAFDECIQCGEAIKDNIILGLLINGGTFDLTAFTGNGERLILDLYKDDVPEAGEPS